MKILENSISIVNSTIFFGNFFKKYSPNFDITTLGKKNLGTQNI